MIQPPLPHFPQFQQTEDLLLKVEDVTTRNSRSFLLGVFDVRDNRKLWERTFQNEPPYMFYSSSGKSLTVVIGDYDAMKMEAAHDRDIGSKLNAIGDRGRKKASYILLSFDGRTGRRLGALVVDSGNLSFKIRHAVTVGDLAIVSASSVVSDSQDRVLFYSLETGEQKGNIFGVLRAITPVTHHLLVENNKQELVLYDMLGLSPLAHFTFPARIGRAQFSEDGKSIFIVTVDQTVYSVKVPEPRQSAAVQ